MSFIIEDIQEYYDERVQLDVMLYSLNDMNSTATNNQISLSEYYEICMDRVTVNSHEYVETYDWYIDTKEALSYFEDINDDLF